MHTPMRMHHAAPEARRCHSAGNRHIYAGALYFEDDSTCLSRDDVGIALTDLWGAVFGARPHDDEAAARFLPYTVGLGLPAEWRWVRGTLHRLVEVAIDIAHGLDGLGRFSLWAHAPDVALGVLDDIAEATQDAIDLPITMHSSRSVPNSLRWANAHAPPRHSSAR